MQILVADASRTGSSAKIAGRIADQLRAAGTPSLPLPER
jgi:menaquinone-dependent protoporphyrinogen IX oxidase